MDKPLKQYLEERGPVKLYEKIQQLEAERDALIDIVESQKQRLEMEHAERLYLDIESCNSPSKLQVIATGHLVEAIRSLNPRMDMMELIERFHMKFQLEYDGEPRQLSIALSKFRVQFLHEELKEYRDAVEKKDLEGQLDALVDLVYVALGTAYLHGFDFNEAFKRVHDANMKKVRAAATTDSKRKSKFDVVKPANWKAPYLKDLV